MSIQHKGFAPKKKLSWSIYMVRFKCFWTHFSINIVLVKMYFYSKLVNSNFHILFKRWPFLLVPLYIYIYIYIRGTLHVSSPDLSPNWNTEVKSSAFMSTWNSTTPSSSISYYQKIHGTKSHKKPVKTGLWFLKRIKKILAISKPCCLVLPYWKNMRSQFWHLKTKFCPNLQV